MPPLWKRFCAPAALVIAAGCASTSGPAPTTPAKPGAPTTTSPPTAPVGPERAQRATRSLNLAGFPPEYQKGYRDGCAAVGTGTNLPPPGTDAQTTQGWRDGFAYCTRRPPR